MSEHLAPVWRVAVGDDGRAVITYCGTGTSTGTVTYERSPNARFAIGEWVVPDDDGDDEPPAAA